MELPTGSGKKGAESSQPRHKSLVIFCRVAALGKGFVIRYLTWLSSLWLWRGKLIC